MSIAGLKTLSVPGLPSLSQLGLSGKSRTQTDLRAAQGDQPHITFSQPPVQQDTFVSRPTEGPFPNNPEMHARLNDGRPKIWIGDMEFRDVLVRDFGVMHSPRIADEFLEELDALEAALRSEEGQRLASEFSQRFPGTEFYGTSDLIEIIDQLRMKAKDTANDGLMEVSLTEETKAQIGVIQSFLAFHSLRTDGLLTSSATLVTDT